MLRWRKKSTGLPDQEAAQPRSAYEVELYCLANAWSSFRIFKPNGELLYDAEWSAPTCRWSPNPSKFRKMIEPSVESIIEADRSNIDRFRFLVD